MGVSFDIKYGGNTASRLSAIAYFDANVSQLGDADEVTASIGAYTQLKTLVGTVITNTIGANRCRGHSRAEELIDIIIDVLTAGNLDSLEALVEVDTAVLHSD